MSPQRSRIHPHLLLVRGRTGHVGRESEVCEHALVSVAQAQGVLAGGAGVAAYASCLEHAGVIQACGGAAAGGVAVVADGMGPVVAHASGEAALAQGPGHLQVEAVAAHAVVRPHEFIALGHALGIRPFGLKRCLQQEGVRQRLRAADGGGDFQEIGVEAAHVTNGAGDGFQPGLQVVALVGDVVLAI